MIPAIKIERQIATLTTPICPQSSIIPICLNAPQATHRMRATVVPHSLFFHSWKQTITESKVAEQTAIIIPKRIKFIAGVKTKLLHNAISRT